MKKLLVIGLGSIGRRHAKIFRNLGHEIYGVDSRNDRVKQAEQEIDIKLTSSNLDEMLKNYEFDASLICTPPNSHTEIALKLAKKSINIFVEKPLANNDSKLDKLSDLCDSNTKPDDDVRICPQKERCSKQQLNRPSMTTIFQKSISS